MKILAALTVFILLLCETNLRAEVYLCDTVYQSDPCDLDVESKEVKGRVSKISASPVKQDVDETKERDASSNNGISSCVPAAGQQGVRITSIKLRNINNLEAGYVSYLYGTVYNGSVTPLTGDWGLEYRLNSKEPERESIGTLIPSGGSSSFSIPIYTAPKNSFTPFRVAVSTYTSLGADCRASMLNSNDFVIETEGQGIVTKTSEGQSKISRLSMSSSELKTAEKSLAELEKSLRAAQKKYVGYSKESGELNYQKNRLLVELHSVCGKVDHTSPKGANLDAKCAKFNRDIAKLGK